MKMKSPVSVVSISLACLFAIFHSCHGIRCYSCQSRNYGDEKCEKISGKEHLFDYGEEVQNCMKTLMYRNDNGHEERILVRAGFADEVQKNVDYMLQDYKDKGFEIDVLTCRKDKCNGK